MRKFIQRLTKQKNGVPLIFHCKNSWAADKQANGCKPPCLFKRCTFGWKESGVIRCPSHAEMVVNTIIFLLIDFPLWILKLKKPD